MEAFWGFDTVFVDGPLRTNFDNLRLQQTSIEVSSYKLRVSQQTPSFKGQRTLALYIFQLVTGEADEISVDIKTRWVSCEAKLIAVLKLDWWGGGGGVKRTSSASIFTIIQYIYCTVIGPLIGCCTVNTLHMGPYEQEANMVSRNVCVREESPLQSSHLHVYQSMTTLTRNFYFSRR